MAFNTYPQNPFPPNSENAGGSPYVLPIASAENLGGVKVGDNLTIDENGELSAPAPYTPHAYSTTEIDTGRKWIDNKSVYEKVIVLENAVNVTGNAWLENVDTIDGETCISVQVLNTSGYCFPFGGGFNSGKLEVLNSRATTVENVKTIICEYTKTESEV